MTGTRPEFTTATFWLNTGERVVRTGAQTALALGITDATTSLHVDWQQAGITVGLAMLASLLMALAGKTVGDPQSPSFLLAAAPKHRAEAGHDRGGEQAVQPVAQRPPEHLGQLPPLPPDRDSRQW